MIQKILSVAVAALLIGSGCSRSTSTPQPAGDQSESAGSKAVASSPVIDPIDDAELHRNILVNFGADINTGTGGKPLVAHTGASLFLREDWDSEHPMPEFDYFAWNFGQMWNERITDAERQTKYAHPSGKDNPGYFFPRELYEARAQQYFDVSVDALRSITEYDAENKGYYMQAGFGMGVAPQIELRSVEQQDDVLKLHITLVYNGESPSRNENKILCVRISKDGSYRYVSYTTANGKTGSDSPAETAVFALDLQGGDQKAMSVGDTLGDWTLTELKIDSSKANNRNNIRMLTAVFAGNVTLKGTLTRNGLVEIGYDFSVSKEEEGKMPHYISSETEAKDNFMFMLNLPDDLAKTLDLPHGEQKECKITISSYRFVVAYSTAPSSATVVHIEML